MKKTQLALLIGIAACIGVLLSFLRTTSTYDTIETARKKPGQFVHVMAKLDKSQPIEYDALNNPNYLRFAAVDSLGARMYVQYNNAKPENLEMSDRLVLKGRYRDSIFLCQEIQTKCPSKYKEEEAKGMKHPGEVPLPNIKP
ncbi:MAG: cytochrome c maturation protein CcmE [Bacteroidetes bacterium]|nr:cytochrome c maturation protein CcmE [Bacteroidota bacterium]